MIVANIKEGELSQITSGLWQYDYGQILRIQGLGLPPAVEIHFSLNDTCGESVTRIGTTKDGVTDVVIPDSMLENNGVASNYYIYVFVYLTDEMSGQTVRKIKMRVKSRPKPEAFGTPENAELFREAIAAVNESASRAEDAEKRAEEYAAQTAEDAQTTEAHRQIIENAAAQVALNKDAVSQDRQATVELKNQAQTAASEALLAEQRAKESENAASESRAGAEAAEDAAAQHELAAEQYKNSSEAAKEAVMKIGRQISDDGKAIREEVEEFNIIHQQAVADVQNAAAGIVGDREQIKQNKTDITELKSDLNDVNDKILYGYSKVNLEWEIGSLNGTTGELNDKTNKAIRTKTFFKPTETTVFLIPKGYKVYCNRYSSNNFSSFIDYALYKADFEMSKDYYYLLSFNKIIAEEVTNIAEYTDLIVLKTKELPIFEYVSKYGNVINNFKEAINFGYLDLLNLKWEIGSLNGTTGELNDKTNKAIRTKGFVYSDTDIYVCFPKGYRSLVNVYLEPNLSSFLGLNTGGYFDLTESATLKGGYYYIIAFLKNPSVEIATDEIDSYAEKIKLFVSPTPFCKTSDVERILNNKLKKIACFGDSLTAGGQYAAQLSYRLGDEWGVSVYGVGGENTKSICGRIGSIPLVVEPFTIPATTDKVDISVKSSFDNETIDNNLGITYPKGSILGAGLNPCNINGIEGNIYKNADGTGYQFARTSAGEEVEINRPTFVDSFAWLNYKDKLPILFMGQNGGWDDDPNILVKQIESVLDTRYKTLNERYIVVGLHTKSKSERAELEKVMQARFGRNYINTRNYMARFGLADAGITQTATDTEYMLLGKCPPSLLSDGVHFNAQGYIVLGNLIYERGKDLGYWE